ncbi:MAG: class I SAM-dependent methyltransferase [Verrucomicrobia bacterium]|nr:class I SAM-dependent methyltransferase [Verrucomicrobiota bacterium]
MATPLRKLLSAEPTWLPPEIWEQIEATDTDAFLAAHAPALRIERWGDALRIVTPTPPIEPLLQTLFHPPTLTPWKPARIIFQMESTKTATFLLGSIWTGEARELGLTYGIDLTPGISPGLFPDQRENRAQLRTLRPHRLLNLFAHTCAFGVVAAAAGAETLNIDSSSRSLARGKENYHRNQFTGPRHRFWAEDVRRVLPRLIRRGEKFDAVILDPPTFAHGGRGRAFRMDRELEPLLLSCHQLLSPHGSLLLSINEAHTTPLSLASKVRELFARQNIPMRIEPGLRPADTPSDRMPATLWIIPED